MTVVKKASPDGETFVFINDKISMLGAGRMGIAATSEGGNFINGPVAISSTFDKIRTGGVWRFNTLLASTIPSNLITPIPTLEIDLPTKEVAGYASITAMILSTLSGTVA